MAPGPPTATEELDRDAAQQLAAEVERAGGRLRLYGSTLLALFEADAFDAATCRRLETALEGERLESVPPLRPGTAGSEQIEVRSRRESRHEQEPPTEPAPPPASVSAPEPAAVLAEQVAALPAAAITAGVLVPGLLLAVLGFAGWWAYGLLFLALSAAVWLLARGARIWLARIFFVPLRSPWLSGFVLVAAPLLLCAAVASVFVIAPVASGRAAEERRERAGAQLAVAERSLRDGDLRRARRALAAARREDSSLAGTGAVAQGIEDEQQRRTEEAERRERYEQARMALESDDERDALDLLAALEGYRDSDELARAARRDLAGEQLDRARAAFRRDDFATARDTAAQSIQTMPTKAARDLEAGARRALARARARARARAEARAQARAAARRRAAEARRQREQAREQARLEREQQAAPAPEPSAPSAPSGTCSEIGITDFAVPPGDDRDADGDGIACES